MFYDYLINDEGYTLIKMIIFLTGAVIFIFGIYSLSSSGEVSYRTSEESKLNGTRAKIFLPIGCVILVILFLLPSRDYIVYYNGDPREALRQQLKQQYEDDRENRERVFFECLDKGQKQPHSTTFNDTNEVVKTCFNVSTKL